MKFNFFKTFFQITSWSLSTFIWDLMSAYTHHMPDIVLCVLHISSHLTFIETLWGRHHAELADKESEVQKGDIISPSKGKIGFETKQCDFITPDFNCYPSLNEQIPEWFNSAQKLLHCGKWLNWVPFPLAL